MVNCLKQFLGFCVSNEYIVFIEDTPLIMEDYKEDMQEIYSYRKKFFTDPLKALTFIEKYAKKIKLIVTDERMPDVLGGTVCEVAKLLNNRIKCLMITAYKTSFLLDCYKNAGYVEEIIEKPVSKEKLYINMYRQLTTS
jgi:CheY-like chemotaxis protein